MVSCSTQAVLSLVGLAADQVIRERCICIRSVDRGRETKTTGTGRKV
ncbi:MAG: hypothetical protein ACQESR_05195 [Planctomycetota bacterium]